MDTARRTGIPVELAQAPMRTVRARDVTVYAHARPQLADPTLNPGDAVELLAHAEPADLDLFGLLRSGGIVVFVGAGEDGKASVVVGVTDDLTARFSAVDLVRVASAALGGQGGGGRPDMAQAGGPDASKAEAAIAAVKSALAAA